MRSEGTDDTPEGTARSDGADTPRRKPTEKDKDKDPPPSRVRVSVRVRPEVSEREQGTGHLLCQGGRLWLVEGGKDGEGGGGHGGMASPRGNKESTRQFVFDAALPPTTTQQEVFNATCLETGVLQGVSEGFNGCVMCYGQTGAGKTYTLGNAEAGQEGIVPRVLRYLLDEEPAPPNQAPPQPPPPANPNPNPNPNPKPNPNWRAGRRRRGGRCRGRGRAAAAAHDPALHGADLHGDAARPDRASERR